MKTLLVIPGMARSGTTSLTEWLMTSEDVFESPIKEPNWLLPIGYAKKLYRFRGSNKENFVESGEYLDRPTAMRNFGGFDRDEIYIDASTIYFSHPNQFFKGLNQVRSMFDRILLMVVERDPFERAASHYLFSKSRNEEYRSFEGALKEEIEGLSDHWTNGGYLRGSKLSRFMEAAKNNKFSLSNIKIIKFRDLIKFDDKVQKTILDFVKIKKIDVTTLPTSNKTTNYRFGIINKFRGMIASWRRRFPFLLGHKIFRAIFKFLISLLGVFEKKRDSIHDESMRSLYMDHFKNGT